MCFYVLLTDPYAHKSVLTISEKSKRARIRLKNMFPDKYKETNRQSVARVQDWRRDTYGLNFRTRNERGVQRTKVRMTSRGLMYEHDVSEPADPLPKQEVKEEVNNNDPAFEGSSEQQQQQQQPPPRVLGTVSQVKSVLHKKQLLR